MSKLDELIKQYCPDGVDYEELGKYAKIETGQQLNKTNLTETGVYPVYNGGIYRTGYYHEYNAQENTIAISQGGASAGFVNFVKSKFWAGAHCYTIIVDENILNNKYVYYILKNSQNKLMDSKVGAGIPGLNRKEIQNLLLPIPPLQVQEEIVKILDKFTELTAELTAELNSRRIQYEYYRDSLLSNSINYKQIKLNDLCNKITDGSHNPPKQTYEEKSYPMISAKNINNGLIDFEDARMLSKNDFLKENKRTNVEVGNVLLTIVGTIGRIAVVNKAVKMVFQRSVAVIKNDAQKINSYYLKYLLESSYMQKTLSSKANGSAQKGIYLNQIKELDINVPSLAEQDRIVAILDKFDSLVNDITKEGLPAEIEKRKQQYEYYRNKLLTFKELKK